MQQASHGMDNQFLRMKGVELNKRLQLQLPGAYNKFEAVLIT